MTGKEPRAIVLAVLAGCTLVVFAMSGCWDMNEIENRALVLGIGIDESDDGQVLVAVQMPTPSALTKGVQGGGAVSGGGGGAGGGGGGTSGNSYSVVTTGLDGWHAWKSLDTMLSRNIDASQVQLIVIGERLATSGVARGLDFLAKMPQLARTVPVVVTKDVAQFMAMQDIQETSSSTHVSTYFTSSRRTVGGSEEVALWRFWVAQVTPGVGAHLPVVTVNEGQIMVSGAALFRGDRMVGSLDASQARALRLVRGRNRSANMVVEVDGDKLGVIIGNAGVRVESTLEPDDTPRIDITMRLTARVADAGSLSARLTPEFLDKAEVALGEQLKADIMDAVARAQEMGSDPFMFGDRLRGRFPDKWSASWWLETWPKAQVIVDVTASVHDLRVTR